MKERFITIMEVIVMRENAKFFRKNVKEIRLKTTLER